MVAINIEMPKSCMRCQVSDSVPDCPCKGNTLIFDYRDNRHTDCPLIEIEQSEDCVSRQAVFETIDDCNSDGLKGIFCSYDDGERFKEYIKKLPPVTPTQKDKYEWLGKQFKKMDAEFMQTLKGESNNG